MFWCACGVAESNWALLLRLWHAPLHLTDCLGSMPVLPDCMQQPSSSALHLEADVALRDVGGEAHKVNRIEEGLDGGKVKLCGSKEGQAEAAAAPGTAWPSAAPPAALCEAVTACRRCNGLRPLQLAPERQALGSCSGRPGSSPALTASKAAGNLARYSLWSTMGTRMQPTVGADKELQGENKNCSRAALWCLPNDCPTTLPQSLALLIPTPTCMLLRVGGTGQKQASR